jgi:RNA polymerase sigma-70 factor (ECF subfamily)
MENAKQGVLNGYAKEVIRHKAKQLIGKYGFTRDDYEDLQQEMTLDLLRRLGKYDPEKSALTTFVAQVVDRRISTLIRHRKQEKRDYRRQACSLNAPVENGPGEALGMDEILSQDDFDRQVGRHADRRSDRLDLSLDFSRAMAELPDDLRQLAVRLQTQTMAEIARELGVPRTRLYDKGITRLRKLFEDKGLREYLGSSRHIDKPQGK